MANNTIALLAKAPELDTPFESQAKAMQIRSLMNQGEVQNMDMQAKRQAIEDDGVVRQAYAANPNDSAARLAALSRAPKAFQAEQKALQEAQKVSGEIEHKKADTRKTQIEAAGKAIDIIGQAMNFVYANPTLANANSTLDQLESHGLYTPEQVANMRKMVGDNPTPENIKKLAEQGVRAATATKEQLVKFETRDLGGSQQTTRTDPVTGAQTIVSNTMKTQSPDSVASNATQRRGQNMVDARAKATAAAAASGEGMLPDDTVSMMAQQYLAGDTSVMQNLGRGAQGAQNIIKLRKEITRQNAEQGKGGADLAAQNSEYFGTKAGQRAAGTRIANVEMASNEAESLIPLARSASTAVARSSLLPFGKAQVMFDTQTNDPALRQFAAANNALVNVYSRAISPSGTPTVADKEHAREMISTAMDDKSYQAVLDQMQMEITAAKAAPQSVRKAFNAAVTGKGGHGAPPPAPAAGGKPSLDDIFGKK